MNYSKLKLAYTLKDKYCPQYTIQLTNAIRVLGACNTAKKVLKFSKQFIEQSTMEDFQDTVLHEIAHALTPGHKHDKVWKAKAIEIGCSGNVTYKGHLKPPVNYILRCPICGEEWKYIRKPSYRVLQGYCSKCKQEMKSLNKHLELIEVSK